MSFKKKSMIFISGGVSALVLVIVLTALGGFSLVPFFRVERLKNMEANYGKLEVLRQEIVDNYYLDLDEDKLYEGMIYGMFDAVDDKYTSYMNPEEYKQYNDSTQGKYVGIGIQSNTSDERIQIVRVFEGSPAQKAGIQIEDEVIAVDELTIEDNGYRDLLDRMLGQEGQEVLVKVKREGEVLSFTIKRGSVKIPFVDSQVIGQTGYLVLYQFGSQVSEEFESHLKNLLKQDVNGIIIDLRDNPGGLVTECTEIADQLLPKGTIVYTLDKYGNEKTYKSKKDHTDIPLVFLANENSASASEILLAAVRDFDRAPIVGVQTFGKGIVQSVAEYGDGSGFKITYSQYFSPQGNKIHKIGVSPDYEVNFEGIKNTLAPDLTEDPQLKQAYDLLNQ